MNWIDILTGTCLMTLGILWLNYQIDKTGKYKKNESYSQLATQPSQYVGILILILGGILMILRGL
ncbi:hypothetical protein [uncultured Winogradskyella sp.]|uniref:hypothetical protein n=1 Tax=uncultured Winogradskyella sp. TaxID=395353 RepID=UPI0026165159|nr:hypothetical protein [uncultured Winogradskyella sp.]